MKPQLLILAALILLSSCTIERELTDPYLYDVEVAWCDYFYVYYWTDKVECEMDSIENYYHDALCPGDMIFLADYIRFYPHKP